MSSLAPKKTKTTIGSSNNRKRKVELLTKPPSATISTGGNAHHPPTVSVTTVHPKFEVFKEDWISCLEAGCWTLKECYREAKTSATQLERLEHAKYMSLLADLNMMDEQLVKELAASHLQSSKGFTNDTVRHTYDVATLEYDEIRKEFFPKPSREEEMLNKKLLLLSRNSQSRCQFGAQSPATNVVSSQKPKGDVNRHASSTTPSTNGGGNNDRFKRATRSITASSKKKDSDDVSQAVPRTQCKNLPLPTSDFCIQHIESDPNQKLFTRCIFDNITTQQHSSQQQCCTMNLKYSQSHHCDRHIFVKYFGADTPTDALASSADLTECTVQEVYALVGETQSLPSKQSPDYDENNPIKHDHIVHNNDNNEADK